MRSALPNFRGQRALVLHWKDSNRETLVRQLESLGLKVDVLWPVENISAEGHDVIFFDADQGYDGLFEWPPDQPPIPLIAMMGSEAPGRIEWTLSRAPSAYLVKPIGSTGVFSALAIAFRTFETQRDLKGAIAELTRRAKARPVVFKVILRVMAHFGIGDDDAYQLLRAESMNQRISMENLCELIASNGDVELDQLAIRIKGGLRRVNRG
jgi:AmiR/NasT family two-component response regulator